METLTRNLVIPAVLAMLSVAPVAAAGDVAVENPRRALTNWILNCQGCHQPDASGSAGGAPNMAGVVAKFLSVEGGREFLIRVPGVANAPLDAHQLADLVNWMLVTFDAENLPEGFEPFTAEEIAGLRSRPYIEEAEVIRAALLERIEKRKDE